MKIRAGGPSFHHLPPPAAERPRVDKSQDESPIEQTLFGSVRPKPLDPAKFPQLAEQLRWLQRQKLKIASFVGDADSDYALLLAEGNNACIDPEGRIYIGATLLARAEDEPALVAGVLAHEIGHRPKTWRRYRQGHGLSRAQLLALARQEEAKADMVAGRALAALDLSPDPLCAFLEAHGHFEKQPENYFPVPDRVRMIRDAHAAQAARKGAAKGMFPGFARESDVKHMMQSPGDATGPKPKKRRFAKSG